MIAAVLVALPPAIGATGASSQPPRVGVYTVDTQSYTVSTTLPGRVVAYRTAAIRPQVEGIIRKRLFTAGAHVEAGDVLYKIDPAPYRAALAQAKAALAQAQAKVQSAAPAAERARRLFQSNALSEEKRDSAVAALAQAKAGVASAKADLQSARINLEYTDVKAPIPGRIDTSAVTVGGLVTANQSQALTTIRQIDPIYVDVQQSQAQYARHKQALASGALKRVGDTARVRIQVGDNSDWMLPGELKFTSAAVDSDTGSVRLRAVVKNPRAVLLPGMFARVELIRGVDVHAILLPQQAVLRAENGQPYCYVLTPSETAARRSLQIAAAAGNRWRVTAGLSAGDHVLVQGLGKVRDGETVDAVAVHPTESGSFAAVKASG